MDIVSPVVSQQVRTAPPVVDVHVSATSVPPTVPAFSSQYMVAVAIDFGLLSSLHHYYWAHSIAVPSVTRCRCCCCCGHRFYIAIHQVSLLSHAACAIDSWLRLILVVVSTVATPGEWQCKIRTGGVRRSGEWAQHFSKCFLLLLLRVFIKRYVGRNSMI